jgi:hypothetical protein
MLSEKSSRKDFLKCAALSTIAGAACYFFFRTPDGAISFNGVTFVVFPALTAIAFLVMKTYSAEAGGEDG